MVVVVVVVVVAVTVVMMMMMVVVTVVVVSAAAAEGEGSVWRHFVTRCSFVIARRRSLPFCHSRWCRRPPR